MGKTFDAIDDALRGWIDRQRLFFVATAPNDPRGHVNLSPKGGMDTFRVLGPRQVAYIDLLGSGIETVAHLRENGRIALMFCAFEGPPKIVRLHGRGRVVQTDAPEFAALIERFQPDAGVRSALRGLIVVDLDRITDSCGFVVPRLRYEGERETLFQTVAGWREEGGDERVRRYLQVNNAASIDGLPGLNLAGAPATEEEIRRHGSAGRKL